MRQHINRSLSNALLILADVGDLLPPDSPEATTLAEAMRLLESMATRPTQGDDRAVQGDDTAAISQLTH